MMILVKFPTRARPDKFMMTLGGYIHNASNLNDIKFLITVDENDYTMNKSFCQKILSMYSFANIEIATAMSSSKVHAINRDLNRVGIWHILVLASDDMVCQQKGWDDILRAEMATEFPDTDGVLWHNDGYLKKVLNTMCIMGRRYFDRFNYIYHPEYSSLWCDNEYMEVAEQLGKQKYFEQILFKHEHPSNNHNIQSDQQYKTTESFYWKDKAVYDKRKSINFNL